MASPYGKVEGSYKLKAMILEGDYTDKEIPPYFEGMKSVGECEELEVVSCNKNLINTNIPNLTSKGLNFYSSNGNIIINGTSTGYISYDFNSRSLLNERYIRPWDGTIINFYKDKVLINKKGTYTMPDSIKKLINDYFDAIKKK